MDFSAWSPSHTLLLVITLLAFGGQLVAILTYLKTTAKQHSLEIQKLAEQMQRQEDRMDKRISDVRDELRIEIQGVRDELRAEIRGVRDELRGELRDVRTELSKMNQNHIDHLNRHHD